MVDPPYQWTGDTDIPDFDQDLAESYVGKHILVGITYLKADGEFLEIEQLHGIIRKASPKGIEIDLQGKRAGEKWIMPPSLDSIIVAKPGVYTLKTTGEAVEDPDLLSTWTATKPVEQ